jgi:hypothetical protein
VRLVLSLAAAVVLLCGAALTERSRMRHPAIRVSSDPSRPSGAAAVLPRPLDGTPAR